MKTIPLFIDTPPNSLKNSNASPKVKTIEEEGVGAQFLTRNTSGVGGRAKVLRWGLG